MSTAKGMAAIIVALMWLASAAAWGAQDDEKAREQFDRIVMGIEDKNFELIKPAISQPDMTNRVFSEHVLPEQVRQAFRAGFWPAIESAAMQRMPNATAETKPEVARFTFKNGRGEALLRYRLPNHVYVYQIWSLRHTDRGRMRAMDWQAPNVAVSFVEHIGEELLTAMPIKSETRRMFGLQSADERQVFQATELLKAIRDNSASRFFEIYDDAELATRKHLIVAKAAIRMSLMMQDADRFMRALELFSSAHGNKPRYGFFLSDMFFRLQAYDRAYTALANYHRNNDLGEGGIPSRLSALALATGNTEDAEAYALEATQDEPDFELGWWSLLRARAKAEDHAGSLLVLETLEDDFDKRMDEAKLRRDRYGAFIKLAESDEFQKWRATRR